MDAAHSEHDIQKEVKRYIVVFVSLACLTVITVGVSYLHLKIREAVTLALFIATVKGSLVACYFMHLISEKKLIYAVLIFTITIFIALFLIPLHETIGHLHGTQVVS